MRPLAFESPPPGGGGTPIITYTGYNISNARKLQFCKQPLEIIQGQNTVQCVNKQTVVLLLHFPDLLDLQSAIIKLSNH